VAPDRKRPSFTGLLKDFKSGDYTKSQICHGKSEDPPMLKSHSKGTIINYVWPGNGRPMDGLGVSSIHHTPAMTLLYGYLGLLESSFQERNLDILKGEYQFPKLRR
jgi:hypothetical protein